jgi:tetratricopeptide (TPR) repeat protein
MAFNKSLALKNASKYVRQGKYRAAIQEYCEILKADPADTTTLNLLGDLYVRDNNVAEAVRTFAYVADLYCQLGRTTQSIAVLKKAAKLDPQNLDCAARLARLYAQEGLMAEAEQQNLVVAECYLHAGLREQGFNVYEELIRRNPAQIEYRLRLAEARLREEMRAEAYEAFHAAAQVLQRQNRHEEALKTYLKALAAQPEGRGALNAAVNIYLQRGETQPAEALIQRLLRARPEDTELLALLGHVQQIELALSEARRAIVLGAEGEEKALQYQAELVSASDRAYLTFMAAVAELQRQGREREALATCLKALKLKPGDMPALFVAVNLYLKLGDTQSAVVTLRHTLRAQPENVELLRLLGSVYQQAHDSAGAEQVLSRAVALQPACYRELLEFAAYCVREGELERALGQVDRVLEASDEQAVEGVIELLQEMVGRDPNCLGAHERLVNMYTRLYDTPRQIEALNSLAAAAMFKGEDELAARALRWLIQLQPEEVWHVRLLRKVCPQDEAVRHLAPEPRARAAEWAEEACPEAAQASGEFSRLAPEVGGEVTLHEEAVKGLVLRDESERGITLREEAAPRPEAVVLRVVGVQEIQTQDASWDSGSLGVASGFQVLEAQPALAPVSIAEVAAADDTPAVDNRLETCAGPAEAAESGDSPASESVREVFVGAGTRRRRLLNQRAGQFTRRPGAWRVGGTSPRRSW